MVTVHLVWVGVTSRTPHFPFLAVIRVFRSVWFLRGTETTTWNDHVRDVRCASSVPPPRDRWSAPRYLSYLVRNPHGAAPSVQCCAAGACSRAPECLRTRCRTSRRPSRNQSVRACCGVCPDHTSQQGEDVLSARSCGADPKGRRHATSLGSRRGFQGAPNVARCGGGNRQHPEPAQRLTHRLGGALATLLLGGNPRLEAVAGIEPT